MNFKSILRRQMLSVLLVGCGFLLGFNGVKAQSPYPTRPITIVVGFPSGSAPDIAARGYGQAISAQIKQAVVVDNKPGAGGQIAARMVAKSPPDGYTLLFGDIGSIAIAPSAYRELPYAPSKDFTAVTEVVATPFALVTSTASKQTSFREFLMHAKAPGQKTMMATFGPGTIVHLGLEMLAGTHNLPAEFIHYRNTGELVSAVIAGDVQVAYVAFAVAAPQVAAGKLRVLAVTSEKRTPMLPDAPTLAELGMPALSVSGWITAFVPKATPPAVVDFLRSQLEAASRNEALKLQLVGQGFILNRIPPTEVDAYVQSEAARWAVIVKKTGFSGN